MRNHRGAFLETLLAKVKAIPAA